MKLMYPSLPTSVSHISWSHVGFSLAFIGFNSAISQVLQLQIGGSLVIAALRCMAQLTIVGAVLQHVLAVKKPLTVAWIALLLNVLGTSEIVIIKAQIRFRYMFPAVLVAMLVSTIPVSIVGVHLTMNVVPFWTPEQYLPLLGMLCGNAITGISVSLGYILKELEGIHNDPEMFPGTIPPEKFRLLAIEALRLGLMPTINQMSVIGIIAIPGMMMRAILDGSDVEQAARLQMIIIFMISSSDVLSCIIATHLVLRVCVDSEHRIRGELIDPHPHALYRASSIAVQAIVSIAGRASVFSMSKTKQVQQDASTGEGNYADRLSERTPLCN